MTKHMEQGAAPKLPFSFELVGFIKVRPDTTYVLVTRQHPLHPYVTYMMDECGNCHYGHYIEQYAAARSDLISRANASSGKFMYEADDITVGLINA